MREDELPTWQEIFRETLGSLDAARSALADAQAWLRSDWRPVGSALPESAGSARGAVSDVAGRMKGQIDHAKGLLHEALRHGGRPPV